jgi:MoxR-like ATPase
VGVGYQGEAEEREIVSWRAAGPGGLVRRAVRAVRLTREHPDLRIGSSVRGAIDVVAVAGELAALRHASTDGHGSRDGASDNAGRDAAVTALSGRITLKEGVSRTPEAIVEEIWQQAGAVLSEADEPDPTEGKDLGSDRHRAARATPASR